MSLRNRGPRPAPRCHGDGGAAVLEFALVALLLLTLVFGIISFGLILSFKQDVTRAAAEGARAAAVALPSDVYGADDPRRLAGVAATEEAVDGFDRTCGADGMECVVQIHDCDYPVAADDDDPTPDTNGYHEADPAAASGGLPNTAPDCVTVKLRYDHAGHPIVVPIPLISAFLPDEIAATSVVRLNQ